MSSPCHLKSHFILVSPTPIKRVGYEILNSKYMILSVNIFSEHLNPHKNALDEVFTTLRYINLAIAVYYILEQIAKLWAYGIVYCQKIEFLYDGLVSSALITIQIIEQTFITSADNSADTGKIKIVYWKLFAITYFRMGLDSI